MRERVERGERKRERETERERDRERQRETKREIISSHSIRTFYFTIHTQHTHIMTLVCRCVCERERELRFF